MVNDPKMSSLSLAQQVPQHFSAHDQEEDGEDLFESVHRQTVGQAGAQGRGEDAQPAMPRRAGR